MAQRATKRAGRQGPAPNVVAVKWPQALTERPGSRTTPFMVSILLTLNAVICVALIILILLQRSEASSGGMFGGTGSGSQNIVRNPLAKPTAVLAGLFLIFSIMTAVLNKGQGHGESVMNGAVAGEPAVPVLPDAALTGATPVSPTVDNLLPGAPSSVVTPTTPTN